MSYILSEMKKIPQIERDQISINKQDILKNKKDIDEQLNKIKNSQSGAPKRIGSLLTYYGYPISYKDLWDVDLVVAEINNHSVWVVGDFYQKKTHEEYASTLEIITKVRAGGTLVYGYVPLGVTTDNRSMSELHIMVDDWSDLGVDGIFIDEFGFDYDNTRQRQVDLVSYVHGKGLPYCANTFLWSDFLIDNINDLPFGPEDWKYEYYTIGNPEGIILPRNENDSFMVEDYMSNEVSGALDMWATHQRVQQVLEYMKLNTRYDIWGLSIVPHTANVVDMTKFKEFNTFNDFVKYAWASSYIHGFKYNGISGVSIGSGGSDVIEFRNYGLSYKDEYVKEPIFNYDTSTFSRVYGDVTISVITKKLEKSSFSSQLYSLIDIDCRDLINTPSSNV